MSDSSTAFYIKSIEPQKISTLGKSNVIVTGANFTRASSITMILKGTSTCDKDVCNPSFTICALEGHGRHTEEAAGDRGSVGQGFTLILEGHQGSALLDIRSTPNSPTKSHSGDFLGGRLVPMLIDSETPGLLVETLFEQNSHLCLVLGSTISVLD
ncbi:hypothetical protein P7K49_020042 [Saguinus oedipus]|uniref:IPT/TIG domain-containing protein n=1 Tax=Saguinus oedipus TaxID=9490 RepID=A0ABQ9V032_SAGOE|nr:hypothetical protein P7K49_020042 [Saguinus oedipus]